REVNDECTKHVKMLSEKIMEWLSEGLGLRREAINEVVGGEYLLNVNYYPPCPHPDVIRGLNPHTDVSGLTLLITNEIPGFQVFKDDQLIEVEYIPFAVIVNISDQILSVLHQTTVDKERIRMSWVVLVRPTKDTVVGPFPELIGQDDPPKFRPMLYKDYIYRKTTLCKQLHNATYANLMDEIKEICYSQDVEVFERFNESFEAEVTDEGTPESKNCNTRKPISKTCCGPKPFIMDKLCS
ncbi:unnamed protein product, partial [Brassica oleracea var. botrytis]